MYDEIGEKNKSPKCMKYIKNIEVILHDVFLCIVLVLVQVKISKNIKTILNIISLIKHLISICQYISL